MMATTSLPQAGRGNELSRENDSLDVLLVNCSPRRKSNTQVLLNHAGNALSEIPNTNIQLEAFAGKTIQPCRHCFAQCSASGRCILEDDFDQLAKLWLQADAILLGSPVYTFAPPAPVLAYFERLAALQQANPTRYLPKTWPQPVGIISQGGSEYGGVEICTQSLLSLCLSVGCIPLSGDMPGFSQGVIGQVPDGQPISVRLTGAAKRLSGRIVELAQILSAGKNSVPPTTRVLLVKIGEFPEKSVLAKIHTAFTHLERTFPGKLEWEWFDFGEHEVAPCEACTQYCSSTLECRFDDGMQLFRRRWFSADVVIWLIGSEAGGSTASFQAAIDRMNEVRFESFFASGANHMMRHLCVSAGIMIGPDPVKLASTWQRIQHVSLLYQNLVLPASNFGPGVLHFTANHLAGDRFTEEHITAILSLVEQSARLALVCQGGLLKLGSVLPEEYFPRKSRSQEALLKMSKGS